MDQLVCMRSFVRVADLHSFTRAADALGISRAVVSTHVAELERHLRCQLFHRTTRRVGLTSDGAEYLARCQRILAELEAADETLRRTRLSPQGRLRVDVPVVFGRALLIPALPNFTARYPDLQLEVQFNDRVIDLIAEEVDLVVRVGAVREPHLVARRVVTTRLLTCAARASGSSSAARYASSSRSRSTLPSIPSRRRSWPRPATPASCRPWIWWWPRRSPRAGSRSCCASGRRRVRPFRSCAAARCATRPRSGCSPTLPRSCCCSTGDAWTRCWIEAPQRRRRRSQREHQRPERSVSCSSARSCNSVESEAGRSWLAFAMNAGTCAAGSGGLIRYPCAKSQPSRRSRF